MAATNTQTIDYPGCYWLTHIGWSKKLLITHDGVKA